MAQFDRFRGKNGYVVENFTRTRFHVDACYSPHIYTRTAYTFIHDRARLTHNLTREIWKKSEKANNDGARATRCGHERTSETFQKQSEWTWTVCIACSATSFATLSRSTQPYTCLCFSAYDASLSLLSYFSSSTSFAICLSPSVYLVVSLSFGLYHEAVTIHAVARIIHALSTQRKQYFYISASNAVYRFVLMTSFMNGKEITNKNKKKQKSQMRYCYTKYYYCCLHAKQYIDLARAFILKDHFTHLIPKKHFIFFCKSALQEYWHLYLYIHLYPYSRHCSLPLQKSQMCSKDSKYSN